VGGSLEARLLAYRDRAGVPVIPAYFDYASKVIGIGPPFVPGTDMRADIARIQRWYKPHRGRNHDVVQPAD